MNGIGLVSMVWEDNIETQNLPNSEGLLMSSRKNHIGIKYHWFRSNVRLREIEVNSIGTKEQRADLFTKGLTRFEFEQKRRMIMG